MSTSRSLCGVAYLGNMARVFGGEDESEVVLASAECFDIVTRTWALLPPMPMRRAAFAYASSNGKLYVIGGHNDYDQIMQSAEVFDLVAETWSVLPAMVVAR